MFRKQKSLKQITSGPMLTIVLTLLHATNDISAREDRSVPLHDSHQRRRTSMQNERAREGHERIISQSNPFQKKCDGQKIKVIE